MDLLLIMGTGHELFREYLLASAAADGPPLWALDPAEPTWQAKYLAGHTVCDVFDPEAARDAVRRVAAEHNVLGVFCWHEAAVQAASEAAAELGLPGPDPEAVRAVRDKSATRRALTEAGLPQPAFHVLAPGEGGAQAAAAIGFPLVVKPIALGASQGVIKVDRAEDLAAAVAAARRTRQAGMRNDGTLLLEQYLTGPEISVDAAVIDGEYLPYALARKQIGPEPYFEEMGHTVDPHDPLLADAALTGMLAAAHEAVGWRHGSTHTEVKLTPSGPVLVEINGRLGGDLIPYLGMLANGIDSGVAGTRLALGARPDLTHRQDRHAAIRFLVPPCSAVVDKIALPPARAGELETVQVAAPGDELLMPPDGYIARYGCLIAMGGSANECQEILDRAEAETIFECTPLRGAA
ncbi:ATP-grasp domain-containing protein [Glycomyces tritici]|uniref:ATP-grasp domain-containing protein n=1 Tax=Glycomyces tritici TaxID=2665176 RepID=A0ABT7YT93_9ACTN|nr:ATP-grasp domain-containing protein [Glycomyces tritici]MDN3241488.1 ATP-grasp domain-containing protein [Glycomyces tritici]MDN3242275.1 ATP-grasp domain-containing protein [Glycomyces tritici]